MSKDLKQRLERVEADLRTEQKRCALLEQAQRADAERIKALQDTIEGYRRRAYSARIVVHELIDMALFEREKE